MKVSVRALCEFTARTGDLDHRLRPTTTAVEGLAVHRRFADAAREGRRCEVPLEAVIGGLRVRGRADAVDDANDGVEEVKSSRGDPERMPAGLRALHRAQLETYAALYAIDRPVASIRTTLTYIDVDDGRLRQEVGTASPEDLLATLAERAARYERWACAQVAHRRLRDAALQALHFPLDDYRPGQRAFAGAVFRSLRDGRSLLAQAPTGIGKSLAAVFGALKAMPAAGLDKLVLLTCRTTGAQALHAALAQADPQRVLRIVELGSRERDCERPGAACQPEQCDLARGFHDRLPAARAAALGDAASIGGRAATRAVALAHDICPYHFAHEQVRWADVVIADVNHYFDSGAGLPALALAEDWRLGVVVDEAHNLVERARAMYGATLAPTALQRLRACLPDAPGLRGLSRSLLRLLRASPAPLHRLDRLPDKLADKLAVAAAEVGRWLADPPPSTVNGSPDALQAAFDLLRFQSLATTAGRGDLLEASASADEEGGGSQLRLRCIVPADRLRGPLAAARALVLMSATLAPVDFHRRALGLADDASRFDCDSPFAGQLDVRIVRGLSTRWRDRDRSTGRIAELVAGQLAARPGNYLVFASSYAYLARLQAAFATRAPQADCWIQQPGMDDRQKAAFAARFAVDGCGVGFAVLGGGFSEGIDLVGTRLVGAFIASLGMPPPTADNEASRSLIDAALGDGWRNTYLVPGLAKVAQAGGRVVRGPADRGVLFLLDDRFGAAEVAALLPRWWFGARSDGLTRT